MTHKEIRPNLECLNIKKNKIRCTSNILYICIHQLHWKLFGTSVFAVFRMQYTGKKKSNIILKSNFATICILHIRGDRKLYCSLSTQKLSLKGFKYQDTLNHCNNVYWLRMKHRWHYKNGITKFYIILIKAINEYLEQIFNTLMETWKCLWHMFLFLFL